jgi:ABC-type multidrug transport system fused ATPase/permease subunit
MRLRLFRSLLDQEVGFFDEQSTGQLISRLTSDIGEVANDLTWVFRWSLEAVVRVGGISVYLFWVSWQLALLVWMVAPLIALVNLFYGRWLKKVRSN